MSKITAVTSLHRFFEIIIFYLWCLFVSAPSFMSRSFLAPQFWQILYTSNLTRNREIPIFFPDFGQYLREYIELSQRSEKEPFEEKLTASILEGLTHTHYSIWNIFWKNLHGVTSPKQERANLSFFYIFLG